MGILVKYATFQGDREGARCRNYEIVTVRGVGGDSRNRKSALCLRQVGAGEEKEERAKESRVGTEGLVLAKDARLYSKRERIQAHYG